MRLLLDVHVHTVGSYDAETPVEAVLERAAEMGLDGVVVTDHDAMTASRHAAAIAGEYGLVGVPGVEVSTAHGHLLAIGVDERPDADRPLSETVAAVRDLGGAAVVPHPFQWSRHGVRRRDLVDCDGLETFNAHAMTGFRNRSAAAVARDRGLARLAGSDAHVAGMVGRAATAVTVETDADSAAGVAPGEVVDAIRAGRTTPVGTRIPLVRSLRKYVHNARLKAAPLRRVAGGLL